MAATIPTNGLGVDAGLDIAGGNLTFTTADKGVHLGVTSATASNLLDDYEEGTWSPQLKGSDGTNFTMSSGQDVGYYVKIGNKVFFHAYIVSTSINSAGGNVQCGGLPFTVPNATSYHAGVSVPYAQGLDGITSGQNLGGYVNINTTDVIFFQYNHSTGGGQFASSSWSDNGGAMITGHYTVT